MTDILLVTAVLRTENLYPIAKNIAKRFKDETELHPVWVWCFDQYNADMSPLNIKKAEVVCLENNITYIMYYQGTQGQENYGGALMNGPLQDLKNKIYKDSNPLVYVLDDDNIIHPNFIATVKNYCLENEQPLWMNMVDEYTRFYLDFMHSQPSIQLPDSAKSLDNQKGEDQQDNQEQSIRRSK